MKYVSYFKKTLNVYCTQIKQYKYKKTIQKMTDNGLIQRRESLIFTVHIFRPLKIEF